MRLTAIIPAILAGLLCSCVTKTHTPAPTLEYARKYVSDAKDYNSRASKTNNEIDAEITKLLEGAE